MRELRFRCKRRGIEAAIWENIHSMRVAGTIQGGSTDYPRILSAANRDIDPQDVCLQQRVDNSWEDIEFNSLSFKAEHPRDSQRVDVSVISALGSPRHVVYNSHVEIKCIDEDKPNICMSCDGHSELDQLTIWQIIAGDYVLVHRGNEQWKG